MIPQKVRGYALGALAAASYGTNPIFAVPLYGDGLSPDDVLFWRYLLAIPMVAAMMAARGRRFGVTRRQLLPLSTLGLMMALSSLTLFMSYRFMPVGIASTLLFVYPLLVAVLMSVLFHERFRLATAVCLALALSGIGLLYRGGDGATLSLTGTALVMASTLAYAIYIVGTSQTSLRTMPTLRVTLYVLAFGLLLFAARLVWTGSLHVPSSPLMWLDAVALAFFPTLVSFLCTTAAIRYVGSTPTAILGALEPVTAVLLGIVLLGEAITLREALGMALILGAVTVVVAGSRVGHVLVRIRKMFPARRPRAKAERALSEQA